jgi:hypothetical protein
MENYQKGLYALGIMPSWKVGDHVISFIFGEPFISFGWVSAGEEYGIENNRPYKRLYKPKRNHKLIKISEESYKHIVRYLYKKIPYNPIKANCTTRYIDLFKILGMKWKRRYIIPALLWRDLEKFCKNDRH